MSVVFKLRASSLIFVFAKCVKCQIVVRWQFSCRSVDITMELLFQILAYALPPPTCKARFTLRGSRCDSKPLGVWRNRTDTVWPHFFTSNEPPRAIIVYRVLRTRYQFHCFTFFSNRAAVWISSSFLHVIHCKWNRDWQSTNCTYVFNFRG